MLVQAMPKFKLKGWFFLASWNEGLCKVYVYVFSSESWPDWLEKTLQERYRSMTWSQFPDAQKGSVWGRKRIRFRQEMTIKGKLKVSKGSQQRIIHCILLLDSNYSRRVDDFCLLSPALMIEHSLLN